MRRIRLKAQLDTLGDAAAFLEECLEEASVPMKAVSQMNIVADELLSNIARYSGASYMEAGCEVSGSCIRLEFRDDGCPFNPTLAAEPDITLPAGEREPGCLGILMVKRLTDGMEYANIHGENILTVMKAV